MATTSTKADVYYPESDGEPMGETIQHRDATIDLIQALQDWFADDPLAYVSGDDFIYYVEGQPRFVVSPDVWCGAGIDKSIRRKIFKTWLEGGKGPELVVEMTSPSTRRVDQGKKLRIYRDVLKVREYFLFDPLDEYLDPVLQGYRLVEGDYRPIEAVEGRLPSEVLGLHLEAEEGLVRLFEPMTGRRLLNRLERIRELTGERQSGEGPYRELLELTRTQQALLQTARREAELAKLEAEKTVLLRDLEIERLRRELEALQAGQNPKPRPKRK
jgi:Uma2 family endonuclease